jgi:hypothetical protein
MSLQNSIKVSYRFSPECGPDNLQKSTRIPFRFQSTSIQCAVILRNGIQLGEVQASKVNEIRPGAF